MDTTSTINGVTDGIKQFGSKIQLDVTHGIHEIIEECNPMKLYSQDFVKNHKIRDFINTPYMPGLHQPGWMLRYLLGPYDVDWAEGLISDSQAGLTVVMTLVPQVR